MSVGDDASLPDRFRGHGVSSGLVVVVGCVEETGVLWCHQFANAEELHVSVNGAPHLFAKYQQVAGR